MTRSVTRWGRWCGGMLAAGALALACGAGQGGSGGDADAAGPDARDVLDAAADAVPDAPLDAFDVPAPPPLVRACGACHDLEALADQPAGGAGTPREWLAVSGVGLVRDDPAIPAPGVRLVDPWPHRGWHDPSALAACDGCHPVDDQGLGHDLRVYPDPTTAFQGGKGCADACHGWIGADVDGVNLAPQALLAAVETAHTGLWRDGARPAGMRFAALRPGCGGCHNARAETHGAVLTCLDCHTLGGPGGALHQAHVVAIGAAQEQQDLEGAAAGVSACGYCHDADDDVPLERWRPGCHGCHLSGHQPIDATGLPHFWSSAR